MDLLDYIKSSWKEYQTICKNNENRNPFADPPPPSFSFRSIFLGRATEEPAFSEITAFSIPQWAWNSDQCRAWLYQVFTVRLKWSPRKAKKAAKKFVGIGPCLSFIDTTHHEAYRFYFGEPERAIHPIITEVGNLEGAVPK
ncbi:hypothetical protein DL95DRAFT_480799 [Leptodontidium sp. 2 PMI_412]|nr:hypothetical protein DL95DRAFT_480799 [Leptodontidium sp. 2 PMI_412]